MNVQIQKIEKMIYQIRGQKVMLDNDLADLYGVETKYLNRQVKRNIERFPSEFMFKLTKHEVDCLRCQFVTFKSSVAGRKYLPYVFTEFGVAMLSGVLNSNQAINCNIAIIKAFIKLRKILANDESIYDKISSLEKGTNQVFKIIFERLDDIEEIITPKLSPHRRKIGLKN
ncbi:MAG: hypothetical protein A2381_05900 [Bdellovibrionales bacterium RIFOXYB1_FULL_37_110]|nr:MAG: hypothetical protein A2417_04785 [Bdellovibrionales bacterium RIFOXYC1_FULL_37_79]OFZ59354.1 MAG: hypothetical protein A2381_05900 [Bdellovibrionales bacterium RIFOXYB1_FULL_37_110]OFZ61914.1 MAG: hypothetical protein A2577_17785 [Bdellovibrionales bacterium RIFOXYD1_FULL_36_51]